MMKMKHAFRILIPVLLCSSSLQASLPPEFSAEYSLHKFGMHAAQASSSLQRQQDGSWLYRSQTETRGLISVFRKDRIIEQTVLKAFSNEIKPVSYQYIHKGSKKNRDRSIIFDWNNMSAGSLLGDTPSTVTIGPETIDNFSMQLKLMLDLKAGKRPLIYNIIRKGKVTDYEFKVLGNETIETDAGDFDTVKLERSREDSKRTTIMWTAPALHYLPVKIMHIETDGSQFSLLLNSVSGNITEKAGPAATATNSD